MQRTTVVNLYGGPGTGKSTTAAALFALLKQRGVNAELVNEYAKGWAWEGRKIQPLDQFYLFGKQLQRESKLYGKVDVIVTDSPIAVSAYYAQRYCPQPIAEAIAVSTKAARRGGYTLGVVVHHVDWWLLRTKAYNPAGRFETPEQALEVDFQMRPFVEQLIGMRCESYGTESEHVQAMADALCPPPASAA